MRNKIWLSALILACGFTTQLKAQNAKSPLIIPCNTFEMYEKELNMNGEELQKRAWKLIDEAKREGREAELKSAADTNVYIIPVVFHILHTYGSERISDAECLGGLDIMNIDYMKKNADTITVSETYKPLISNPRIQYRIVRKDPQGNCTSGIERIFSRNTKDGGRPRSLLNNWPNTKYLNIWVVNNIYSDPANPGTVLANATFPGTPNGNDGVLCRSDAVGPSSPFDTRTLTHELGHYFGLSHPFGGNINTANCGDDGISDTPKTSGFFSTCPGVANRSLCNKDIEENTENFMDYASCPKMFTIKQGERMRQQVSPGGGRSGLTTPANLEAVGATPGFTCAAKAIADFRPTTIYTCAGTPIQFDNLTYGGAATSYKWTFEGGTPSTSTDAKPSVVYNTPGSFRVTLEATNAAGTTKVTRDNIIIATGSDAEYSAINYTQNFESGDGGWRNSSEQDSTVAWDIAGNVGTAKSKAFRIRNFNITQYSGLVDYLVSPKIDFTYLTEPKFRFKLAAADRSTTAKDELKVSTSTDCGKTWVVRSTLSSNKNLSSITGVRNAEFIPAQDSEFKQMEVDIKTLAGKAGVLFRFESRGNVVGATNNVYIDDIEITGVAGFNNPLVDAFDANIFPNPNSGNATLTFNLNTGSKVKVEVYDIIGRHVSTAFDGSMNAGTQKVEVASASKGMYLVKLTVDGVSVAKRMSVE